MNSPQRRAPRTRDLRLSLTAGLAFLSWGGLLAFFTVIPVLYLRQTAGRDMLALKASWPLSAPLVIGGACGVVILFLLYYLMASGLRCQVCGGAVFGGGDTHRKHPNARKFLGLSYSRRVAWEILTSSGFQCMHCQTFCRNRRRGAANETNELPAGSGALPPVFQVRPLAAEATASNQLFNTLFTPAVSQVPQPSGAAETIPPLAPASAAPAPSSPFALVGNPLGVPPAVPDQHRPMAHPAPIPWAHHPAASPFVEKPVVMNPSIPEIPSQVPSPFSPAGIRALIPPQPRIAPTAPVPPPAGNSPFTPFSPPAPSLPAAAAPLQANVNPAQPMSSPFTVSPAAPTAPAMPWPLSETKPTAAPAAAPAGPTPAQVVAQVTKLMEKTRTSLDEMFSKMLDELKKVMETPETAAAPAAVAASTMAAPVSPPQMVVPQMVPNFPPRENALPPPPPQQVAPRLAPVAITLPSLPGINLPKPVPAVPPSSAPEPEQAAEMNAVLARAFAQSQRPAEPSHSAPAPNPAGSPGSPDWRNGFPPSPFSLAGNQAESGHSAATLPPAPNVLPFPPLPQPPPGFPVAPSAPAASQPLPQLPPLAPVMPPAAVSSPFAMLQSPTAHAEPSDPSHLGHSAHGPSFPSPFAGLPELEQRLPEPPPMPAPFTFLSQHGNQFVPDPDKLPPQWAAQPLPATNPAPPNQQALQFAQMQAQQLAQFQAQQLAQKHALEASAGPPPFIPQWPTQNGQL